jgi:integrase
LTSIDLKLLWENHPETAETNMQLDHLLIRVCTEVDLEQITLQQYRRSLRKYSEFIGKPACVCDLTPLQVNQFLASLKAKGLTGTTVQNYKSAITRVWNYAVEKEIAKPYDSRQLRKSRIDRRPVRAWTASQVKLLIAACKTMPGTLQCGLNVADFLGAWVRIGYDTGLRPVDLRMLRWSHVDIQTGTIAIVQNKTHQPHTARLSDESKRLLERIQDPTREYVFPLTKSGVRRIELLLYQYAKSGGFRRIKGQGLGTLRKTHATVIYERDGESAAAESLGHVGGTRTVRASYIDSRSIRSGRLPPDIAS